MIRNALSAWLQQRVVTASMVFGVCRRCMAYSTGVAAVGAILLWLSLTYEVTPLLFFASLILAYGATLCLVHLAFFIVRPERPPRSRGL